MASVVEDKYHVTEVLVAPWQHRLLLYVLAVVGTKGVRLRLVVLQTASPIHIVPVAATVLLR